MASGPRNRFASILLLTSLLAGCSDWSCGGAPPSALPTVLACAGPDQHVPGGSLVRLDGGCTRLTAEAGASAFLVVHWEIFSKPTGSQAFLSARETPWPTFTADEDGAYVVVLRAWVPDRADLVSEDWVTVTARSGNSPPVAVAAPSRVRVKVGETAELDGTGSHDADGDALAFRWTFVEPSSDALDDEGSARPLLVPQAPSTQVVQLVVSDGVDESAPTAVRVEATPVAENAPPLADAGPDLHVRPGTTATLDGSGSRDPDGEPLSYRWRLLWRPPGSAADLPSPDGVTAPFTPDVEGGYLILLSVSDGRSDGGQGGRDDLDSCVVHASTGNRPPIARILGPAATTVGEPVQLDGSASSDPDADPVSHRWSLLSAPPGSAAAPAPAAAETASFATDLPGTYVVRLEVSDGAASDAEHLAVRAAPAGANRPPVANAGPDQPDAVVGTPVTLDGSGSDDPDGDLLAFSWTFSSTPAGSAATLAGAATAHASFTPDVGGTFVVRLEVDDGLLRDADTVAVVARGNRPPVADAGADPEPVLVGNLVTLDGSASRDPDGDPLSFQWSIVSAPAGSAALLGDATIARATLVPDRAGTFVIGLRVSDGSLFDDDLVHVVARDASVNRPPVADAGPDRIGAVGAEIVLDGSGSFDPDLDPLSFQWTLVQRPDGSAALLLDDTTSAASLTPDLPGEYAVRLVVSDGALASAPDVAIVTVAASAMPLTVETPLPFQGALEEPLYFVAGAGDTLRIVGPDSPDASSEDSALGVSPWSGPQAEFLAMWAWTMAARSHPDPVDDVATPRFVLRRTRDGVHFAFLVDFTVAGYAVRIDAVQAWRCAGGPETCP